MDIDITQSNTALMCAVHDENIEVIKKICKENPEQINQRNYYGRTALVIARRCSQKMRKYIMEILLKSGADPNIKLYLDETPIFIIIGKYQDDFFEIVELLLQYKADPNAMSMEWSTPLKLACNTGNKRLIQLLLEYNADPNMKCGYSSRTSLMYTDYGLDNAFEIMKLLLEHNANPNLTDHDTVTPLMVAVSNSKNINIVKILLEHGAHINAQTNDGISVLMIACSSIRKKSVEMINLLLERNANPNIQDSSGNTALILGLLETKKKENAIVVVQSLLENGADINIKNSDNRTIIQEAIANQCDISSDAMSIILNRN